MDFKQLMKENTKMFENWKKDSVLKGHFLTDEEMMKEYLECIQLAIGSKFRLIPEDEVDDINDRIPFTI